MPLAVNIRPAQPRDWPQIWTVLEPVIRAGETYTLPQTMSEDEARTYWFQPANEVFVAESEGKALGTYILRANQQGGGSHVANCGYMTAPAARGQGIARAMCLHSLTQAKARGFHAMQFNFVVSTNAPAIKLWQDLGFREVGRLPQAFRHPSAGLVDVLVMYRLL
ncbi:MAG: GNAT family N-acetyltransferase [Alphaproteobacteria bacterium]|nr:GNAT family N-acetyltransferase [Alphaproteobacteria bacterium]